MWRVGWVAVWRGGGGGSRHKDDTHGVGVTRAWAPAGHHQDHIAGLEEAAGLACGVGREIAS